MNTELIKLAYQLGYQTGLEKQAQTIGGLGGLGWGGYRISKPSTWFSRKARRAVQQADENARAQLGRDVDAAGDLGWQSMRQHVNNVVQPVANVARAAGATARAVGATARDVAGRAQSAINNRIVQPAVAGVNNAIDTANRAVGTARRAGAYVGNTFRQNLAAQQSAGRPQPQLDPTKLVQQYYAGDRNAARQQYRQVLGGMNAQDRANMQSAIRGAALAYRKANPAAGQAQAMA